MRNTISSKENKSVIYVQTVNTGLAVTGVRAVRKKSEREREVERAMEELKKAVVLETGDIMVASRCMGMSELSAAGKFLESGVREARKAEQVRSRTDTMMLQTEPSSTAHTLAVVSTYLSTRDSIASTFDSLSCHATRRK